MANTTVESVLRDARSLTPEERQRLREELALVEMQQTSTPRESLYGVAAHLGPAPSAEDIDEARRDVWGTSLGTIFNAEGCCRYSHRYLVPKGQSTAFSLGADGD